MLFIYKEPTTADIVYISFVLLTIPLDSSQFSFSILHFVDLCFSHVNSLLRRIVPNIRFVNIYVQLDM